MVMLYVMCVYVVVVLFILVTLYVCVQDTAENQHYLLMQSFLFKYLIITITITIMDHCADHSYEQVKCLHIFQSAGSISVCKEVLHNLVNGIATSAATSLRKRAEKPSEPIGFCMSRCKRAASTGELP